MWVVDKPSSGENLVSATLNHYYIPAKIVVDICHKGATLIGGLGFGGPARFLEGQKPQLATRLSNSSLIRSLVSRDTPMEIMEVGC